jgi:aspartate racemase
MTKLGIIGGVGPDSTIEYYRVVIAAYRLQHKDGSYPPILINSIDLKTVVDQMGANDFAGLTDLLVGEIDALARAGAGLGMIAANTPHVVYDDVRRRAAIPLVSIVEAACDEAKRLGLRKVGLFGTRFTMQGRFYADVFSPAGIAIVTPAPAEQTYIHDKYMAELVNGVFNLETRDALFAIAERLRTEEGIDGLILGGTELPLILRPNKGAKIPFLDTTAIHARRAVAELWP